MSSALLPAPAPASVPLPLFAPTPKAAKRVRDFFTAQLHNGHTRKAYLNAICRFHEWCEAHGIEELAEVEPSMSLPTSKICRIRTATNTPYPRPR